MNNTITDFEKILKFVLKWEGGYVNNPDDPGGETNFGISKRSYPESDIKNITLSQVKLIYYRDYWLKAGCDKLKYPMNILLFDCSVNCGIWTAFELQRGIKDWKDYLFNRIEYYSQIKNFNYFGKGWINRVMDLRRYVEKNYKEREVNNSVKQAT